MENLVIPHTPVEQALMLQRLVISIAERVRVDNAIYSRLREQLMALPIKHALVPKYVRICANEGQLWDHLKQIDPGTETLEARQNYIYETFEPLLQELETKYASPTDMVILEIQSSFDATGIRRAWDRALELRWQDPLSAITAARSLLETVFKYMLDAAGGEYSYKDDLRKLYDKISQMLDLAPSRDTEDAFRTILGAGQTAVQNIDILCRSESPAPRHAALAVNLAGSIAIFVVETWEETFVD